MTCTSGPGLPSMGSRKRLCRVRFPWKWKRSRLEMLLRLFLTSSVLLAPVAAAERVTFLRDVAPILNKVGCMNGTCHGAAKGKNGFKLSLRGYDPEFDHAALVNDLSGRRFNRSAPDQSLMLLKPTEGVPHMGGMVLEPNSRYYREIGRAS